MCDQCFQQFCPCDCPNFNENEGKNRALYCVLCGERLQPGEAFYRIHGFPYCEFCLDSAEAEELVRICEIPKRKWLEQMGFSQERVPEGDCV
ncbi:MAG: hypothetical protein IJZ80_09090 [Clostridia bacterium]|nr:hypothetical protein [Clostridia bacterium]